MVGDRVVFFIFFSVKAMYKVLEARPTIAFPLAIFGELVFNLSFASLHGKQLGEKS